MAKHAKPMTFPKGILFIVLLCLIIFTLLFIYKNELINLFYKPNTSTETPNKKVITLPNDTQSNLPSEEFIETITGAEYLEISAFTLDCSSNKSEVTASIKNTSSQVHNNLNILITFLDENNNIVTTLTCPIKSIEPNEIKHTYGIVNLDLSNCTNYEVSLLNK